MHSVDPLPNIVELRPYHMQLKDWTQVASACLYTQSGDENHLYGASLRESHKISLKAHRDACAL